MKEGLFEKRITGIEPFSMLDFGSNLCGILFYNNCTMGCPYCYNVSQAKGTAETLPAEEVIEFLESRRGKLDGIVFSGGECTVWGPKLIDDIYHVYNMGYKIKIDTNGTSPFIIKTLLEKKLIDYVALDFKCPEYKHELFMKSSKFYYNFKETFRILQESGIPFETRTTVHTDIIDEDDINEILNQLEEWGYQGTHYIQFFFPAEKTLGNVNPNMRHFDTSKIKSSIKVEYRNVEGNPSV